MNHFNSQHNNEITLIGFFSDGCLLFIQFINKNIDFQQCMQEICFFIQNRELWCNIKQYFLWKLQITFPGLYLFKLSYDITC